MKNILFIIWLWGVCVTGIEAQTNKYGVSASRVKEIAQMLSEQPEGIGVTYKDRTFWDKVARMDEAMNLLDEATHLVEQGMPPFIDSLYLHLNATNIRLPGENMMNARYTYLYKLAFAECIENKGKFLPAIQDALLSLCHQKPWSIPAHDRNLNNYRGTDYYVDLVVATAGNSIAQCVYMLDDRLDKDIKATVLSAFREKMFVPIRRCLEETKPFYWFTVTNNWNSVCLAGVTGAALALLPDKNERAYFVAAAEKYHGYGMKGYGDDGFCSEGVGYYNYGFRAYVLLREEVCRATQGKLDFFAHPKFVRVAQYGKKIQMINGVCPAYSDSRIGMTPDWSLLNYCDNVLGTKPYYEKTTFPAMGNLSLYLVEFFPQQAWKMKMTNEIKDALAEESDELHAYYEKTEILVARPVSGSKCRLAFSAKGGTNNESHNHNDIASYSVVLGKETMAGDQGGPFSYPGDYFNAGAEDKYKCKGSFGHPVPVIDGKTQLTGVEAKGMALSKDLTEKKDTYVLNCTSAYPVDELKQYIRSFEYDRTGEGSLLIEDKFVAHAPISFETALTTRAVWKKLDNHTIELRTGSEVVQVTVTASDKVIFTSEVIEINAPAYTRIGIKLNGKAANGYIRLHFVSCN